MDIRKWGSYYKWSLFCANILFCMVAALPQDLTNNELSLLLGDTSPDLSVDQLVSIIESSLGEDVQQQQPQQQQRQGSQPPPQPQQINDIDQDFINLLIQEDLLPMDVSQIPSAINCECTPIHQCNDQGTNPTTGVLKVSIGDVVDLRTQGRTCTDPLEVCCRNPSGRIGGNQITESAISCGKRNPLGVEVTVGFFPESQSQYGEFPWTVAVLRKVNLNGEVKDSFTCGGSLIHPQVVLGVAHCIEKYSGSGLSARVGEWNFESTSEKYPHADIAISNMILHPQYTRDTLNHNIALLILQSPVPQQPNINTVCLPSITDSLDDVNCISSGWGKSAFDKSGRYHRIMKEVELPIVNNNECQNILRGTRLGSEFILDQSHICAGGNGADTCEGDGGSPLVCQKLDGTEKYVQVGVVAWGIGCNLPGIPGVYSSVSSAMPWILSEVTGRFGSAASQYFT